MIDSDCEWLYYWYYEDDVDDPEFEDYYFDEDNEGYKYWTSKYPQDKEPQSPITEIIPKRI